MGAEDVFKEFGPETIEFQQVYQLALEWTEEKGINHISNDMEGEILATQFDKFVKTQYPDVYKAVEQDPDIFETALVEWNERNI